MKYLALLLAAATLTFTTAAAYYARALRLEQASTAISPPVGGRPLRDASAAATPAAAGAEAAGDTNAPGQRAIDAGTLAVARHRLEQLRNPVARAERVKDVAETLRAGGWPTIAPLIGLNDKGLDQFLAQMAERAVARQQRRLECQVAPGCDLRAAVRAASEAASKDQAEVLGPEYQARYETYRETRRERMKVDSLRTRLAATEALPAAKAEALIAALADERRRYALASGQQNPSGSDYDQRLQARAAQLLTGAQLAEFKAMQQESMISMQEVLREREIREGALQAAGQAPVTAR